ncbi:hypothetical protein [Saccharothrix sp. Mg75]|uniref:hypothetical protein n=1 Tax=Saccharothrix sp. Mg75 TaxID=3445357 RepID=UPI003EEEE593
MTKRSATARGFLTALLLAVSGVVGVSPGAALAQADCAAEQSALDQVHQQISTHNAKPHVFELPRQAGELAAYDAEAAALNTAQQTAITNLGGCRQRVLQRDQALAELADARPGSPAVPTPRPDTLQRLEQERAKLPPGFTSPVRAPDAKGRWRVDKGTPPRPLYEALREVTPPGNWGAGTTLQGVSRPKVGDRNPALHPRHTIGANAKGEPQVSPDHVVPLTEIVHMPGFLQLNARNMYSVVNSPLNLQWMASRTNISKGSKSAGVVTRFDPAWSTAQVALENRIRPRLQDLIARLLASQ